MQHRIAFIICTEPAIEKQSLLLARSLRQWAGKLADLPIFSFGPRGLGLSESTRAEFRRLGVQHSDQVLNREFPDYTMFNKAIVCAVAEQTIDAEYLVFVDSDMVFFQEPAALLFGREFCAAARPEDVRNVGVNDLSGQDQNSAYWRRLYQLCRAPLEPVSTITTAVSNETIVTYFQGGLLAIRRETAIFSRWADNIRAVMADGVRPSEPYYIEESSFAATVCANGLPWQILPAHYNFPICYRRELPPERRLKSLDDAVSIHYHGVFANWRKFWGGMYWLDQAGRRFEWLVNNLNELSFQPLTGLPLPPPSPAIQQAFASAIQHHQAGRLKDAERLYWQILDQQPNHAGALHYLGTIACGVGRHVLAADLIRQAIAITPNWPEAHSNLASILQAQGRWDEAIAAYRQSLALQPNYPEVHYNLGVALHAKGHNDQAIAAWRQAVALKPDFPEAQRSLAAALKTMA